MATASCEVVNMELHMREIIAGEDNGIQHSIGTFRLYQVPDRFGSWQSECTMSVLCVLIG